ncbi:putative ammonium transporter 1 [Cloeon dipterum]|uniref:putative ammonium transporter 1 n=1 Tax=Cloeon dipterum TaxID=197152 RepID=UPI00321FD809
MISEIKLLHEHVEGLRFVIDDYYLFSLGFLISLMQIGFGYVECGAVRSKSATNVMMKNMMDSFLCGIVYWLFGFAIAFGYGNSFIGYYPYMAGYRLGEDKLYGKWYYELSYASTASTIVSGTVAERIHFVGYLVYSSVISGFVFPVVCHWGWNDEGWLKLMGYEDFSGSGIVHLCGGSCAIVAAIILGPRYCRFEEKKCDGDPDERWKRLSGHSTPISALGAMILFTTFLSFNAASVFSISTPEKVELAAKVVIVSLLSACGCSTTGLFLSKLGALNKEPFKGIGYWSFMHAANCGIMGLVISSCAANKMEIWAGFISGCLGAPFYCLLHHMTRRFKVDDVLNIIPVHFGGGFVGCVFTPILRNNAIPAGDFDQAFFNFKVNAIGAVSIMAWSMSCAFIIFYLLKVFEVLRVPVEDEINGVDMAKHNEVAYQLTYRDVNLNDTQNSTRVSEPDSNMSLRQRKPQESIELQVVA